MTTASKITLVRVVLTPIYMALQLLHVHLGNEWMRWAALAVFVVASVSDFVDGYIARHRNQVSDLGKFLDTMADKLLVTSAFLAFIEWGRMPSWVAMIVIGREFAISGLRMIAAKDGKVIAAAWSGKIKTACTMVGLVAMMAITGSVILDWIIIGVILLTTIYSGVEYFIKNGHCLDMKS